MVSNGASTCMKNVPKVGRLNIVYYLRNCNETWSTYYAHSVSSCENIYQLDVFVNQ